MSPELGLAVFVTVLVGSAALWLSYRALREHRARPSGSSHAASEPVRSSRPSPQEVAALVGRDGFWVCWACRSLNRPEAKRCYACHAAIGSVSQQPAPGPLPVSRGVPVKAKSSARSSGEAAGTTVALATTGKAPPASGVLVRDPETVPPGAPRQAPAGVAVCPFLGFRDDPSTRCDFPDPRNLCHATSKRGATLFASPRRFVTGKAGTVRSQPIDADHQRSSCLSATHEQCSRYPAVQGVPANR